MLQRPFHVEFSTEPQLPVLSSTHETSHKAHLMPSVSLSLSLSFCLSLGALCLTPLSPTLPCPPPNRHAPLHFTSSTLHFTKRRKKNKRKLTEKTERFREGDCMQKRKRKRGRGVCLKTRRRAEEERGMRGQERASLRIYSEFVNN